jgi:hypothetical protein
MKHATKEVLRKYSNVTKNNDALKCKESLSNTAIVRKELRNFVKISFLGLMSIGFYSLGVYQGTISLDKNKTVNIQRQNYNQLEKKIDLMSTQVNQIDNTKQKILATEVELRLKDHLDNRSNLAKETIRNQKILIKKLKNNIEQITLKNTVYKQKDLKPIKYSYKNLKILKYEQQLIEMRLKDKQSEKLKAFTSFADLTTHDGKSKYRDLVDAQKLELFKLQREHFEERDNFRRDKVRNIASVESN